MQEHVINDLVYLQAIIKESLRLYPPVPLSVPHEAMEDCHVCDYYIPKGTHLFVNVWKLHWDPRVWENPEEFLPERFLTSHANVDALGQHFEFIPFGSGRRSYLGSKFSFQVSHLTLAHLLQGFEFQTPLKFSSLHAFPPNSIKSRQIYKQCLPKESVVCTLFWN